MSAALRGRQPWNKPSSGRLFPDVMRRAVFDAERRAPGPGGACFDPARRRAVAALVDEMATLSAAEAPTARELTAEARALAKRPLREAGRDRALALVAHTLQIRRSTRVYAAAVAASRVDRLGDGARWLPTGVHAEAWEGDPWGRSARAAAFDVLEAITVAWPPPGAARVWHPPRAETLARVQALAAGALQGPDHLDPGERLALIERYEHDDWPLPERHLGDALDAIASLDRSAPAAGRDAQVALGEVVSACAALSWRLAPDRDRWQLLACTHDAARIIDGAGFAGGANADAARLLQRVQCLLGSLPELLARYRCAPDDEGALDRALSVAAEAVQTSLVALWVCASGRARA